MRDNLGPNGRYNGAYYYSIEICERMIPLIRTNRQWVTVNIQDPELVQDGAIVFVHRHHYQKPGAYDWLAGRKDLIFVCSLRDDLRHFRALGTPIYLPLSVDVEFVKQFRTEKTEEIAFVGREERAKEIQIPEGTRFISGLKRENLLRQMAKYRKVYALDRVAIEAQILGCEVLPYPHRWIVIDNTEAAALLQNELDKIDGQTGETERTGGKTEAGSR